MYVCQSVCLSTDTAMYWVDWQQQQHRLDLVESVLLLLQLCGGGKSQSYTAGLAASSAAFSVRYTSTSVS